MKLSANQKNNYGSVPREAVQGSTVLRGDMANAA